MQTTNCIATDTQLQPLMLEHEGQQPEEFFFFKIFLQQWLSVSIPPEPTSEESFLLLRELFLGFVLVTHTHICQRKMATSSYKRDYCETKQRVFPPF